jgi:hypothetical protein
VEIKTPSQLSGFFSRKKGKLLNEMITFVYLASGFYAYQENQELNKALKAF